jgi:hypothetical protein
VTGLAFIDAVTHMGIHIMSVMFHVQILLSLSP